jgi:succinate dehydrogenase/fumarate reductase iron-sulfur protein
MKSFVKRGAEEMDRKDSEPGATSSLFIQRFQPETMNAPILQEYQIPLGQGFTVLDGLNYIYENLDSSLAFRASCLAGLCMVCLIQINGRIQCPCKTLMAKEMKLAPLPNKKVIRDLVVDLDP